MRCGGTLGRLLGLLGLGQRDSCGTWDSWDTWDSWELGTATSAALFQIPHPLIPAYSSPHHRGVKPVLGNLEWNATTEVDADAADATRARVLSEAANDIATSWFTACTYGLNCGKECSGNGFVLPDDPLDQACFGYSMCLAAAFTDGAKCACHKTLRGQAQYIRENAGVKGMFFEDAGCKSDYMGSGAGLVAAAMEIQLSADDC